MRTSIQLKIVMIYLCTIFIIMLISGTYIVYNTQQRDYKSIQADMEELTDYLKTTYSWKLDELNPEDIKNRIGGTNRNSIYILTPEGKVSLGTSSDIAIGQSVQREVVIRAITTKEAATDRSGHFIGVNTGSSYTDHARPILNNNNEIQAIIYITANVDQVYENMLSTIQTIVMGSLAAMVITGAFGITFSNMITLPIKELTKSAKELALGNTITRIPINSNDEIGDLTQSFNYMATQLSSTMETVTSEKNKLEKIFEHMADGVMAFNRQGVLIHVNSVCYDMIGVLNMGHRFNTIAPKIGLNMYFEDLMEGKRPVASENMFVIGDKYLNMHFDVYVNAKGEPDGIVIVIQDVTKQQKLDLMRKEFVANVSHELRTPLTTVKSYTETLIDGAIEDKDTALHFLEVMDKEADRMTSLVQDLLELSRIDNKQIQLHFAPVNMKQLIEEVIEAQNIHMVKKGHQLIYETDQKERYFMSGDSTRIKQIMHNLLSNAIKYSIDPGTIKIKLTKGKSDICVQIEDTGIGIPEEDVERIFERFYRVDKARSRKLGGTGLGLSIAKEMIELHGGTIKIESQIGKGTKATMHFKEL